MGLKKREGEKRELDEMCFHAMDSDGDGMISLDEFENNMPTSLRIKLDEVIGGGWVFDEEKCGYKPHTMIIIIALTSTSHAHPAADEACAGPETHPQAHSHHRCHQ